jgi:NADPH:quinone reductase-like Zn-dependent oxidoreductase
MKALVHHRYGPPDVLEVADVERPAVDDETLLIRVRAASVNPLDWHLVTGTPYIARLPTALRRPKDAVRGLDVAGRVEAVGRAVTRFRVGDDVLGLATGSFAEYSSASESSVVHKPPNVTDVEAACLPVAGVTALQALRDKGRLQPGQTVLINGASGGVGTFAVQVAKALGAEVTGVCSARNVDLVRSIGADHVIDYDHEDFTRSGPRYDLIIDNVGNHSTSARRRAMKPGARCVVVGAPKRGRVLGPLKPFARAVVASKFASQTFVPIMASVRHEDLRVLLDLVGSGAVVPVVEATYRLEDVPAALQSIEGGHTRGKLAVVVDTATDC